LVVYGVYSLFAKVSWPPSKIFGDETTVIGSFSKTNMFRESSNSLVAFTVNVLIAAAINYLDSGKAKVTGTVNYNL
jgi:D-arabinitol dehydrogenase (NADP+)